MSDTILKNLKRVLSERTKVSLQDSTHIPAAVLLLLYPKDGEYCIHLHKRTQQVERHKGEISFPGGVQDSGDENPLATALRETYEEVAIRPEDVTILGQMDDVVTGTGYLVNVFAGTIPHPYPFKPNPAEIEELLEVPLRELQNPLNWREEVHWANGSALRAYSYGYGPHLIYGATAKMVGQFLQIVDHALKTRRP